MLRDAEQVVALLTQADGMSRRTEELKRALHQLDTHSPPASSASAANSPTGVRSPSAAPAGHLQQTAAAPEIQALFDVLQVEFEKEKAGLAPSRAAGWAHVMEQLGSLVTRGAQSRTLQEMQSDRGKLQTLMREAEALSKRPSLKGAGASPGSRSTRLLAALQDLKMFVWNTGMQSGTAAGVRDAAIALHPRIAR